jgi:hypothetical protein
MNLELSGRVVVVTGVTDSVIADPVGPYLLAREAVTDMRRVTAARVTS